MDYEAAYNAFKNQVLNAQKKRVPFEINFRQWCDIWAPHIHARGKMQLQRIDKAAGYVMGNLRIGERPARKPAAFYSRGTRCSSAFRFRRTDQRSAA